MSSDTKSAVRDKSLACSCSLPEDLGKMGRRKATKARRKGQCAHCSQTHLEMENWCRLRLNSLKNIEPGDVTEATCRQILPHRWHSDATTSTSFIKLKKQFKELLVKLRHSSRGNYNVGKLVKRGGAETGRGLYRSASEFTLQSQGEGEVKLEEPREDVQQQVNIEHPRCSTHEDHSMYRISPIPVLAEQEDMSGEELMPEEEVYLPRLKTPTDATFNVTGNDFGGNTVGQVLVTDLNDVYPATSDNEDFLSDSMEDQLGRIYELSGDEIHIVSSPEEFDWDYTMKKWKSLETVSTIPRMGSATASSSGTYYDTPDSLEALSLPDDHTESVSSLTNLVDVNATPTNADSSNTRCMFSAHRGLDKQSETINCSGNKRSSCSPAYHPSKADDKSTGKNAEPQPFRHPLSGSEDNLTPYSSRKKLISRRWETEEDYENIFGKDGGEADQKQKMYKRKSWVTALRQVYEDKEHQSKSQGFRRLPKAKSVSNLSQQAGADTKEVREQEMQDVATFKPVCLPLDQEPGLKSVSTLQVKLRPFTIQSAEAHDLDPIQSAAGTSLESEVVVLRSEESRRNRSRPTKLYPGDNIDEAM